MPHLLRRANQSPHGAGAFKSDASGATTASVLAAAAHPRPRRCRPRPYRLELCSSSSFGRPRLLASTAHHRDARRPAPKAGPPESPQFLMTPRMSSTSTTRWSSSSTLISVPEYLRYTTTSPTLTLTSSWAPAATTSAFWCSLLAVSGSTIPEGVASSDSTGLSSTRGPSGLNLTPQPPSYSLVDAHKVKPSLAIRQRDARFTFSWRSRGLGPPHGFREAVGRDHLAR